MFRLSFFFFFLLNHQNLLAQEPSGSSSQTTTEESKPIFSYGFATGLSLNSKIIGKDPQNLAELDGLRFRATGLGVPLTSFAELRVVDNFSLQLEGVFRALTGIHVKNENRLWYSIFFSLSAALNAKYQFEISGGGNTYRPFVGVGGGVSFNSFRIRNSRKVGNDSYVLYDFFLNPAFMWQIFMGYKFPLGEKSFLDISFHLNRHSEAFSRRDLSGAEGVGGDFELEETAAVELSQNSTLTTKPFFTYDLRVTWGWSL